MKIKKFKYKNKINDLTIRKKIYIYHLDMYGS